MIASIDSSVFLVLVGLLGGVVLVAISLLILTVLLNFSIKLLAARRGQTVAVAPAPVRRPVEAADTAPTSTLSATAEEVVRAAEKKVSSSAPSRANQLRRKVTKTPVAARKVATPPPATEPVVPESEEEINAIFPPEGAEAIIKATSPGIQRYSYLVSGNRMPFDTLLGALSAFPLEEAKYKDRRPYWDGLPDYVRKNIVRKEVE